MPNTTEPSQVYLDKVATAVADIEDFSEDTDHDLSDTLAYACWRHDWPLAATYFEQETATFSDDDISKIDEFLIKLAEFAVHPAAHEDDDEDDEDDEDDDEKKKMSKNQEDDMKFKESVVVALGLSKTASASDVVAAVATLKASTFSEAEKSDMAIMQKDYKVRQYMEQARPYDSAPGTIEERGNKLYDLATKINPEAAVEQISAWKSYQEAADAAGITKALLDSKIESNPTPGPATIQISKYAEDNNIDFNVALAQLATKDATILTKYDKEVS